MSCFNVLIAAGLASAGAQSAPSLPALIANTHGGRIELESRLGKGTCVTVFLPASRLSFDVLCASG